MHHARYVKPVPIAVPVKPVSIVPIRRAGASGSPYGDNGYWLDGNGDGESAGTDEMYVVT
jgi:hypothetical protein